MQRWLTDKWISTEIGAYLAHPAVKRNKYQQMFSTIKYLVNQARSKSEECLHFFLYGHFKICQLNLKILVFYDKMKTYFLGYVLTGSLHVEHYIPTTMRPITCTISSTISQHRSETVNQQVSFSLVANTRRLCSVVHTIRGIYKSCTHWCHQTQIIILRGLSANMHQNPVILRV